VLEETEAKEEANIQLNLIDESTKRLENLDLMFISNHGRSLT
jgi:hypothetical protein